MSRPDVDVFYGIARADEDASWKVCVRIDDVVTYGVSTYPDEAAARAVLRDLLMLNDIVVSGLTGGHLVEVEQLEVDT